MIAQAHASLSRLYTARDKMAFLARSAEDKPLSSEEEAFLGRIQADAARFDAAMDDDLNTADAIGALFELVRDANVTLGEQSSRSAVEKTLSTLTELSDVLGLLERPAPEETLPEAVQALVDQRAAARKAKDWALSDRLRDQLKAEGYLVEDTAKGQKVSKI